MTWVLGRDGSLTARDASGRWWGGSSLPLLVGRSLLTTLEPAGVVGCFLSPTTAGQVRAALEKASAGQAVIAVVPDDATARVVAHCDDFSAEIRSGRLWFACGFRWGKILAGLLEANPGLPVPQQYIRTALLDDEALAGLTAVANPVFAAETARRANLIGDVRDRAAGAARRSGRVCVVAGSKFAPWDVAGPLLAAALGDARAGWERLDTDAPLTASPLALALAAEGCEAVVAADLFRNDLPGVVPAGVPWVTWATTPRLAAPDPGARADAVLVADAAWLRSAADAGWSPARVAVAGFPRIDEPSPRPENGCLALIADAPLADPPERLRDYSSHGVLWEQIAAELAADPLAVGADADAYLSVRMARIEVAGESFDRGLFLDRLVLPAWRRGVARLLIAAGLPVVVFGEGWDAAPEFRRHWGGPVGSVEELRIAARTAAAVVYPSPLVHAHPVDGLGRPVVRPSRRADGMVREAEQALAGRASGGPIKTPPLSAGRVLSLLPGRLLYGGVAASTAPCGAD